jgi:hypothetical protein
MRQRALIALMLIASGPGVTQSRQSEQAVGRPGSDCQIVRQGSGYFILCPGQPPQRALPFGPEDLMPLPSEPGANVICTDDDCPGPNNPLRNN